MYYLNKQKRLLMSDNSAAKSTEQFYYDSYCSRRIGRSIVGLVT